MQLTVYIPTHSSTHCTTSCKTTKTTNIQGVTVCVKMYNNRNF